MKQNRKTEIIKWLAGFTAGTVAGFSLGVIVAMQYLVNMLNN